VLEWRGKEIVEAYIPAFGWMDGWTETSGQLFSGKDFNQLVHEYNCLVW